MISRICLDVDGVLADFHGSASKRFGYDHLPPEAIDRWEVWEFAGMTEAEFWRQLDAVGDDFWYGLVPYDWAARLYTTCVSLAPTVLLTNPSGEPTSASGKKRWIHKHLGAKHRNYLIGPAKEFCASPISLLIDDNDANCKLFREWGGQTILFPRYWNSNRAYAADPMTFTLHQLASLV